MNWAYLALLSGLGLATRNIAFKLANVRIDPATSALILSLAMCIIAIIYYCYERFINTAPVSSSSLRPETLSASGIGLAVLAGVGVAAANIFLAFSYQHAGPASLVAILQNGFSISVTVLIGALLLGEKISMIQACGIFVAVIGIVMIIKG